MQDISKYTKNAQKYIRYDWAACKAGCKGNDDELERILEEREKFCNENFTLEDYDCMIEDSKSYPPACNMWKRAKEEYLASHPQNTISKDNEKVFDRNLKKAI